MLVLLFAYSINFVQRYIFISNYYFKMQVFLYILQCFLLLVVLFAHTIRK